MSLAGSLFDGLDVAGAPRSLVALGGRLDVETLVAAYRAGCFPWPATGRSQGALEATARLLVSDGDVPLLPGTDLGATLLPWFSPHPRPVLVPERVVVSRTLRKRLRHCGWETTMDRAFGAVIAGCADRTETWITAVMGDAYRALHRAGVAHSLEVWDGDRLVGGLYGVLTGRVFCGESMFHRAADASKVAVVDLCQRLVEAGVAVIDTQDESDHMARLGQVLLHRSDYVALLLHRSDYVALLLHRSDYVALLHHLRDQPADLPVERRPLSRLACRS